MKCYLSFVSFPVIFSAIMMKVVPFLYALGEAIDRKGAAGVTVREAISS